MAKQAALSVRILESIKKDIDKAAAKEHRSTASLVEKILDDYLQAAKTGSARKYSGSNEYKGDPMEMLTPFGRTLGETTKEELKALAEAHERIGRYFARAAGHHSVEAKRRERAR